MPPVAIERVTPHGRPDAAQGVQPSLRGLDGETPSCTRLCGGRTCSKSNGFPAPRLAPAPIPLAQGLLIGQNRLRRVLAEGFGIEGEDVFHTHLGYFLSVIRPYRAAFGIVGRLKRRAEILCHVILSAVPDTLSEVETGRGVHGGDDSEHYDQRDCLYHVFPCPLTSWAER